MKKKKNETTDLWDLGKQYKGLRIFQAQTNSSETRQMISGFLFSQAITPQVPSMNASPSEVTKIQILSMASGDSESISFG